MAKKENNVVDPKDPFGTIRFNEIKAKFGDPLKLAKVYQRRFENITSVFEHRTKIAYEHHNAPGDTWYERNAKEKINDRLKTFKSSTFLCDALQTLLDEKVADQLLVPVKKPRYRNW